MINTQEPCPAGQQILKGDGEEGKEGGFPDRGTIEAAAVQGSSLSLKGIVIPLLEKSPGRGCAGPDSSPAVTHAALKSRLKNEARDQTL